MNTHKFIFLLLISILTFAGCKSRYAGSVDENFSGAVLAAKGDTILMSRGFGKADIEKNMQNTPNTVFRIASLTKQFTAASILILEQEGKLKTGDTVSKYIPDYPHGDKITLHSLLTHTSGIAEHTGPELFRAENQHDYSPAELIALFKDKPMMFEPGEQYKYCNSNYVLLGYIIESVSGLEYKDFIKEKIFTPLGMDNSKYGGNYPGDNEAQGYRADPKGLKKAVYLDMSIPYSAGGLCSTVEDLYKWDRSLYTNKLLSDESIEKMFTPFSKGIMYGYGWRILPEGKMSHRGGIHGFSSKIYRDTSEEIVIIMLSNIEGQSLTPEFGGLLKQVYK